MENLNIVNKIKDSNYQFNWNRFKKVALFTLGGLVLLSGGAALLVPTIPGAVASVVTIPQLLSFFAGTSVGLASFNEVIEKFKADEVKKELKETANILSTGNDQMVTLDELLSSEISTVAFANEHQQINNDYKSVVTVEDYIVVPSSSGVVTVFLETTSKVYGKNLKLIKESSTSRALDPVEVFYFTENNPSMVGKVQAKANLQKRLLNKGIKTSAR